MWSWGWHGVTDIHQVGRDPRKDAHDGDCGEKEAPSPPVVHSGVQGRLRMTRSIGHPRNPYRTARGTPGSGRWSCRSPSCVGGIYSPKFLLTPRRQVEQALVAVICRKRSDPRLSWAGPVR